jgi:hypothetical protein
MREELAERSAAERRTIHHLSETGDVLYTSTRAEVQCAGAVRR